MSKRLILTIATLVLVVTLGGSGASCGDSGTAQLETYIDAVEGFSIDYPQDWEIEHFEEHPTIKVAIWETEFDINPAGILVVKYEVSEYSLESFSEFRAQSLSETAGDYVSISTEELIINGIPAIKHTYTGTVGTTPYESMEIYLIKNEIGWIVAITCHQESFDSYNSTFDTILNSFRLLE